MLCIATQDNSDFRLTARSDTRLGHKAALTDPKEGDTVIKCGEAIGRMVGPAETGGHRDGRPSRRAAIETGGHADVHDLKTRRW